MYEERDQKNAVIESSLYGGSSEFVRIIIANQAVLNNDAENCIIFICNPDDKKFLQGATNDINKEIYVITRHYIKSGEPIQIIDSEIKAELIEHIRKGNIQNE